MRPMDLTGLPDGVPDHLAAQGIEELYPPQAEAVERGVTDGANIVASVPTASGKTLIAELGMLSAVERGGKALYIVPLRALAGEKAAAFERFEEYGISVGVSTGNYESDGEHLAENDVIVATSEKVDSLVRNGAPWVDSLSCVVADEVHLVDDAHRGPTLEVTLAKLRARVPDLQTIALSATIGNAESLASWLDAELVDSTWRPIELRTGVHYGQALHLDDGTTRELPVERGENQTAAIVRDTLRDDGSTLVFVNSRRNAEGAAKRLASVTERELDAETADELAAVAAEIRDVSDAETSETLADAVERGAAFHHAGLAREHRELVEEAFRDRLVRTVCATPTLAAGVNTPARRVVVRDWRRYDGDAGGMKPLDVLEVHQMFGRAGRPGLDPYGEAVLVADDHDGLEELFERYVYADPEPVRSKLAAEPALRTHVLATVASGFATTRAELLDFLDGTLYAEQTAEAGRLEAVTDDVLAYLEANGFLERDGDMRATETGHLVSRLYVDPMSAAEILHGLEAADDATSALGFYHLVSRTPDMYELYLRSGDRERYTELLYEREDELPGATPSEFDDGAFEEYLSALKTAKLLEDWAAELDEDRIAERYGVGPGDIRGKTETASWLLGAAERLAGATEMECATAVRDARKRVEYGVREELLDLAGVRGVGRKRARRLYRAGIEDRAALRNADKSVVLGALRGRRKTAESILAAAGHPEPDVDGVEADPAATPGDAGERTADGVGGGHGGDAPDRSDDDGMADGESDDGEGQASLGDFE